MGDGGNLPQSLPFDFNKYNKRTKEQSEGQGNKKEERKRKEGCIELEKWENQYPLQSEAQRNQSQFWSAPPELRQN